MSPLLFLLRHLTETAVGLLRGDSELRLRHALWRARPALVIALVPEDLALPADLLQGADRQRGR